MLTQNTRGLPETSVDEGATTILDDTYLYDDNGNVREIVDGLPGALGTRTMTYDGLDRLLTVTAGSAQGGNAQFGYDVLDNITRLDQGTRTLRHQYATATNRLTGVKNAAGSTLFTVTHDVRGNQTSRTTGGVTDTFTFDRANRLKASNVGGTEAAYRYDGLGRRMQHTEGGVGSFFQYSQSGQMLFSQDGTNRFDHIYLSGSLVAKRVVPYGSTTSTRRFQHTDALGSPVAETDEVGALIGRERMTAYGEPADGTWTDGPGFTGHDMDASAKLVYMQQRYYDPVVGRFLSVDPVAARQSGDNFNRYWYANSSPYSNTDPDGRECNGRGCWVSDAERQAAASGDWKSYYEMAAAGGDGYAQRAGEVAGNTGATPLNRVLSAATNNNLATSIAENVGADPQNLTTTEAVAIDYKMEGIRVGLARAHVQALDDAGATAENPVSLERGVIGDFHRTVFRAHGADPDAFGGTKVDKLDATLKPLGVSTREAYDYCPPPSCKN